MKKVFIINGHGPHDYSKGALNAALVDRAEHHLRDTGYEVRTTKIADGWDAETEIANHQWADAVILQHPVNWMSVPWLLKQYMDDVYTVGMDGRLCAGDGRTKEEPKKNYGKGGALSGTKYMFSVTFNAPAESFGDPEEFLFEGKTVDDLLFPNHMNAKFFAMEPLPTFAAFDVMKNADVPGDFERFDAHLRRTFPPATEA